MNNIRDIDIAIIGVAMRFPGANNHRLFWQNLCNGIESISFFNKHMEILENNYVNAASVLKNIELFDAKFFGYSKKDAELMDPQHRFFLECSWECFEDAGYNPLNFNGLVGVYAGMGISSYLINNLNPIYNSSNDQNFLTSINQLQMMVGNDKDYLPTKVSYKLNLKGPSVNVQTACSTSLVAVHLACQSILNGECDVALAGAVNIQVPQEKGYFYQEDMVFSPDGHCRAFDANAKGTVFGNGIGLVLIKSASAAIKDGNTIYAIIKGSAINNDGARKIGYTAPSVEGQTLVIAEALSVAGLKGEDISLVEAHGTATPLGDPIEVSALTKAFGTKRKNYCALGSVKTNIGHLGWAAGMAGLIKTALALKHKKIPASLHYKQPNPLIGIENTPFFVNSELKEWTLGNNKTRNACVSAFGIGGTNAHIVLSEFKDIVKNVIQVQQIEQKSIFLLSAKTKKALKDYCLKFSDFLRSFQNINLQDLCFTVNSSRSHHEVKQAFVANSVLELADQIENYSSNDSQFKSYDSIENTIISNENIGFLFTGQGSQYNKMGRQLYDNYEVYRNTINLCNLAFSTITNQSLLEILYAGENSKQNLINNISFTQPALFATEVALANLWMSWGIIPNAVMGHSLGEYSAACIAGIFTVEEGIKIVTERGRMMESLANDAEMIAIFANEEVIQPLLTEYNKDYETIAIAAKNGPQNIVVSGKKTSIQLFSQSLIDKEIKFQTLNIARAGHSSQMDPILNEFENFLSQINFNHPQIPLVSNLTGQVTNTNITFPNYWREHTRKTVLFYDGMNTLKSLNINVFIEMGPKPTLLSMGAKCFDNYNALWLPSLRQNKDEIDQILSSLATLCCSNYELDWIKFFKKKDLQLLNLPTYPFQHEKYWINGVNTRDRNKEEDKQVLKENIFISADKDEWKNSLYEINWEENFENSSVEKTEKYTKWIIFVDECTTYYKGLNDYINENHKNIEIICVEKGKQFKKISDRKYVINFYRQEDFIKLFDILGSEATNLICLWSLTNNNDLSSNLMDSVISNTWKEAQRILYLIRALVASSKMNPQITIFTANASSVNLNDLSGAIQYTLWAVLRIIKMESPELDIKCIDIDLFNIDINYETTIYEILSNRSADRIVFNNNKKYIPKLIKHKISSDFNGIKQSLNDKTYLITGGLRGIGLSISEWLATNGVRHLILVGRSKPTLEISQKIKNLEKIGTKVTVELLDIANLDAVNKLFYKLRALEYKINGIIHSAGVIDDCTYMQLEEERFIKVLLPKIKGAINLYNAIISENLVLDNILLFSSATALIGNAGQANHAAANAFLDLLAFYLRNKGIPATSINWGIWTNIGKLADKKDLETRLERKGFKGISLLNGLKVIEYLLTDKSIIQIGSFPMKWELFIKSFHLENIDFYKNVSTDTSILNSIEEVDSNPNYEDLLSLLNMASADDKIFILREYIKKAAAYTLGINPEIIKEDTDIMTLGMDSLSAIELRNKLQNELKISIPATLIYQYRNLNDITSFLLTLPISNIRKVKVEGRSCNNIPQKLYDKVLSMQQKRWLSLIKSGYGQRVIPIVFYCELDEELFKKSLLDVISRHELLQYYYPSDKIALMPLEHILPSNEELFTDLSTLSLDDLADRIGEYAAIAKLEMPDPQQHPSWAVKCLKLNKEKFTILLSVQHLDFDGTSLTTFINDLRIAYKARLNNKTPSFENKVTQYFEYARWQEHYTFSEEIKEDRAFFEGLFISMNSPTSLPGHKGYSKTIPYPSARYTPKAIVGLWDRILLKSSNLGVTPFSIVLTGYSRLISKLVNNPEVIIGMIVSGRIKSEFSKVIGPFTAPFPAKISVTTTEDNDLANHINNVVAAINSRTSYPVIDLINNIPAFKGLPIDTYFTDVSINFTNYKKDNSEEEPRIKILEILGPLAEKEFSKVNTEELKRIPGLHLVVSFNEEQIYFNFWYHTERFTEKQIVDWANFFEKALIGFIDKK